MTTTQAIDWTGAPFLDRDGRPAVYGHRLCDPPAEGVILERTEWQGVPLVKFQDRPGLRRPGDQWRVPIPAHPVPCDRVVLTRAEGRHEECITVTLERPACEYGPILRANTVLRQWGQTAPREGGYDKCDFGVYWANGQSYEGRFDLQFGGTDGGLSFWESLQSRLFFYAGLRCPPHITDAAQYLRIIRANPAGAAACRAILAACEI